MCSWSRIGALAALGAGRSVAEAARLVGFGSPETLRRVFLNHIGISARLIGADFAPQLSADVRVQAASIALTTSSGRARLPLCVPVVRWVGPESSRRNLVPSLKSYLVLLYLVIASSNRCKAAP